MAHLLLEADEEKVEAARIAGAPVFYGDASRPDTLLAAGLKHARLVVSTLDDVQPALRMVRAVSEHSPVSTVLAACRQVSQADAFRAMPNVRVYQHCIAAALGLAEQVMLALGMSAELVEGHVSAMRCRLDSGGLAGELIFMKSIRVDLALRGRN